ncbi:MAG TPA: M20/M25/M40 family metallo-hydrolase [Gemmatimonadales bacterium]|nr:M20/M25/M40 family metallo-hydrolase [Gemmatimonadales bacterium]
MLSLLLALAVQSPQVPASDSLTPAARRELADVRYLADDARQGRGVGTAGLDSALAYVARAFAAAGLAPGGDRGSYLQGFIIAPDAPGVMHTDLGGARTANVVGVLPGSALAGEVLIIGAHVDHLGMGGPFAMDNPDSTGKPHDGADDNASGVAALMEIARDLGHRHPARTVVFIAFSGEELGDLGSEYFVKHPVPEPIDSVYAMLNMDMVGRLRNDRLLVLGAATAKEFPALLDSLNRTAGFDLRASGDGWGPSDHASFYGAHRPVLHFFTDLHEDYHRTTDRWPKINAPGMARVADLVAATAWSLANRSGALTFVSAPPPQTSMGGSGYGAYLGTIPDMSESPGGVRITGVRSASPAEKAGLAGGDVITAIGAKAVANLYDLTDALRAHQAGDTVVIVVKRGDQTLRLTTVLGKRS